MSIQFEGDIVQKDGMALARKHKIQDEHQLKIILAQSQEIEQLKKQLALLMEMIDREVPHKK